MKDLKIHLYIESLKNKFQILEANLSSKMAKSDIDYKYQESIATEAYSNTELFRDLKQSPNLKREKILLQRFLSFQKEELDFNYNLQFIKQKHATRIILRQMQYEDLSKDKHLTFLDNLTPPPFELSKWSDISTISFLNRLEKAILDDLYKSSSDLPLLDFRNSLKRVILFKTLLNNSELFDNFIDWTFKNKHPIFDLADIESHSSLHTSYDDFIVLLLKMRKYPSIKNKNFINETLLKLKMNRNYGDPRKIPLSSNWVRIKQIAPDDFKIWQKSFNEEDIVFFFNEIKAIHPERKDFWLKYKNSFESIALILDIPTRNRLKDRFSQDKAALEIISRSLHFNSENSSQQFLLVMYSENNVIIEGSQGGFGCQIFNRLIFERMFENFLIKETPRIRNKNFSDFRGESSRRLESWSHFGSWQREFEFRLRKLGIYKD